MRRADAVGETTRDAIVVTDDLRRIANISDEGPPRRAFPIPLPMHAAGLALPDGTRVVLM